MPKGDIILIYIIPDIVRGCGTDYPYVLPNLLRPVRVGPTVYCGIDPEGLFPYMKI